MDFLSLDYYIFLFIISFLYFSNTPKVRNFILLITSYALYFYWNKFDILYLFFITIIIYISSNIIHCTKNKFIKNFVFYFCLICVVGILIYFKINRVIVQKFLSRDIQSISIITAYMPLGITFYSFQAISYFIDVFKKRINSEKNFIIFSLYLSFFPKLIIGPIERASSLIPQLKKNNKFDFNIFSKGTYLILIGLFKKIVLVDSIRIFIPHVFNDINFYHGAPYFLAVFLSSYAAYLDLFAYTDIARGSAMLFNIKLSKNFKQPFLAQSPKEYWRSYHITLVAWFWNYIFLPLARKFPTARGIRFSLIFTFILVGFWHGVDFWIVLWGLLHGIIYFLSNALGNKPNQILRFFFKKDISISIIKCILTQIILIIPLFVTQLGDAYEKNQSISSFFYLSYTNFFNFNAFKYYFSNFQPLYHFVFIIIFIILVETLYKINELYGLNFIFKKNIFLNLIIAIIIIYVFITFANFNSFIFIYSQY